MAGTKMSRKPRRVLLSALGIRETRPDSRRRRWTMYAAWGVIGVAGLIWWLKPPALQEPLAPLWGVGGFPFILLALWGTAFYIAIRRSGLRKSIPRWRFWTASLLGFVALAIFPNAAGGVSYGYLPLESDVGELMAGHSGPNAWIRFSALAAVAIALGAPGLLLAGSVLTVRGIGKGFARLVGVRRKKTASTQRRKRSSQYTGFERTANSPQPQPRIVLPPRPIGDEKLPWAVDSDELERTLEETTNVTYEPLIESLPWAVDSTETGKVSEEAEGITYEPDDTGSEVVSDIEAEYEEETDSDEEIDADLEDEEEEEEYTPVRTPIRIVAEERSAEEILDSQDPFRGLPSRRWSFPPLEMLAPEPLQEIDHEGHMETAQNIESTLAEYGIEAQVTEVRPGPTVTLYGLLPGWQRRYKEVKEKDIDGRTIKRKEEVGRVRVKVDRIAALDRDLALQLKAPSIRIDSPIPGTNLVGVEVPNSEPQVVYIRSQLNSEAFRRAQSRTRLAFPLGKGSGGETQVADLAKMPHLLVAGATGSGKSVFVNSLITSLLSHASPEELRFVMVDPKRVELTVYNGIPHLLTPVIVDTSKVVNALRWMLGQMDERLNLLSEAGVRDISSYNKKHDDSERMPFLVLIIDELADLMITAGKAVEQGLVRLAQMGRATGIHIVVATQRPSVDVVTGLIKANFPTRVSFMVTSLVDSRTILDGSGAEKLLGRGDMLYLPQDAARPHRIQSSFVSEEEATSIVDFWRSQSGGYVPPELPDMITPEEAGIRSDDDDSFSFGGGSGASSRGSASARPEEMMDRARELSELYGGKISTSLLQRRLGVGYPRAARLRDQLVQEGLAPSDIPNAPAETQGRGRRRAREDSE